MKQHITNSFPLPGSIMCIGKDNQGQRVFLPTRAVIGINDKVNQESGIKNRFQKVMGKIVSFFDKLKHKELLEGRYKKFTARTADAITDQYMHEVSQRLLPFMYQHQEKRLK